jgi:hypothetical protein
MNPTPKRVAGGSLQVVLAGLLLAVAIEGPVRAQPIKPMDDGTVLNKSSSSAATAYAPP